LKDLVVRGKIVVDLIDDARATSIVGEPSSLREEDFPLINHTIPNVDEYSPSHNFKVSSGYLVNSSSSSLSLDSSFTIDIQSFFEPDCTPLTPPYHPYEIQPSHYLKDNDPPTPLYTEAPPYPSTEFSQEGQTQYPYFSTNY
jgi:hypothetical protein